MRILCFIFISFLHASRCFCQIPELSSFYPEDVILAKNRVRISRETGDVMHGMTMIREYDQSGREVAWYYESDTNRSCFIYYNKGDTLCRLSFMTSKTRIKLPHCIERFVYNSAGRILFYELVGMKYTSNCAYVKKQFLYNASGHLISRISKRNRKFLREFDTSLHLVDSQLQLEEARVYVSDKAGRIISAFDTVLSKKSRVIDSFRYDAKGRLVRHTSFQEKGFVGEFIGYDIRIVEQFSYPTGRRVQTGGLTWSTPVEQHASEGDTLVEEYRSNGLLLKGTYGTSYSYEYY